MRMKITEIDIKHLPSPKNRLVAIASIVVDGELAVHEIKIMKHRDGHIHISYPTNVISSTGSKYSVVYPIVNEARKEIDQMIIDEFRRHENEIE